MRDAREKLRRCVRCGRLLHYWHYIASSDDEQGCACADDRSCACHKRQLTRKQKQLAELKRRWAK